MMSTRPESPTKDAILRFCDFTLFFQARPGDGKVEQQLGRAVVTTQASACESGAFKTARREAEGCQRKK